MHRVPYWSKHRFVNAGCTQKYMENKPLITDTLVNVSEKLGAQVRDGDTLYATKSDRQRTESEYWERDAIKSAKTIAIFGTLIFVGFLVALVACIVLAIVVHDNDSSYSSLKKVAEDAVVSVPLYFDDNEIWKVPSNIASGGRARLTMTGGGGGGCDGGPSIAGGGGNAGVSVVEYPILLEADGQCLITVGLGGQRNQEGLSSSIMCMSKDGSQIYVNLDLLGGQSGCEFFNGTQPRRGPADYPYTSERVGGRPSTGWVGESHPFGGPVGSGSGGGAGSVFGSGGAAGNGVAVGGYNGVGEGSGGGGGGSGLGYGGVGKHGLVKIVYTVKIRN